MGEGEFVTVERVWARSPGTAILPSRGHALDTLAAWNSLLPCDPTQSALDFFAKQDHVAVRLRSLSVGDSTKYQDKVATTMVAPAAMTKSPTTLIPGNIAAVICCKGNA